jgi:RNA polymerase sigma-70 factor (ECF subfamily)
MMKEVFMGTKEIIEDLYRQYAFNIQKVCYLYLGNVAASEDAMQETFLKAFQKYGYFRKKSNIKTWLTRIAINTCKDILRREKIKSLNTAVTEDIGTYANPQEITLEKMTVTEAICKLPDELREVVILFYYQELSTRDIGNILGIPRTTIEFRLKKARNELKNVFKEGMFDD